LPYEETENEQLHEPQKELTDEQMEGLRILARMIGRRVVEHGRLAKEAAPSNTMGNTFAGPA